MTLHGESIKVGDEVWHSRKGWQKVRAIRDKTGRGGILVSNFYFREDGKQFKSDEYPTLFWQKQLLNLNKKNSKRKGLKWIAYL